jgi:hypothetical protein
MAAENGVALAGTFDCLENQVRRSQNIRWTRSNQGFKIPSPRNLSSSARTNYTNGVVAPYIFGNLKWAHFFSFDFS